MQCVRCGCQNKATNEYCEGCGATLGLECSACGHLNRPTARFCGRCSAGLKSAVADASNPSWQHVLTSLNAKGGERKRLTILFADAGTILSSRETYKTATQLVELDPLCVQTIRRIAAPTEILKLRGLQHAPSSGVFRSGRRLSPLTGRTGQFSTLVLELQNTIK